MFTFKKNKETFDDAMLNNAVDLVADDKSRYNKQRSLIVTENQPHMEYIFKEAKKQCCKLCLYYESESECESLTYESDFSKKYFYESEFESEFLMHESEYESEFRKKNLRVRVRKS